MGLKKEILKDLAKKFGGTEGSIRAMISGIRRTYPALTLNAAAQIFAQKKGKSILAKLDKEDRESLSAVPIYQKKIIVTEHLKGKKSPPFFIFLKYNSSNPFQKKHVEEINKAYNCKCYTAVFILCRKVIQNLIIDLLTKQFPAKTKQNKELYFDIKRSRFHDFSVILKNLYNKRKSFNPLAIKPIERLYSRVKPFVKEANDQTHSWFYMASKKESDDINIQEIIHLIESIDKTIT